MSALGDAADISASTLYYYLPGRQAVLDAVAGDLVDEETVGLVAALERAEGGVDSLCEVMQARVSMFIDDPDRFGVLYMQLVGVKLSPEVLSERIYPASARVMGELERRLAADQAAGLIHSDLKPREFANVGFFAVQGILSTALGMLASGGSLLFGVQTLADEAIATVRRAARV